MYRKGKGSQQNPQPNEKGKNIMAIQTIEYRTALEEERIGLLDQLQEEEGYAQEQILNQLAEVENKLKAIKLERVSDKGENLTNVQRALRQLYRNGAGLENAKECSALDTRVVRYLLESDTIEIGDTIRREEREENKNYVLANIEILSPLQVVNRLIYMREIELEEAAELQTYDENAFYPIAKNEEQPKRRSFWKLFKR